MKRMYDWQAPAKLYFWPDPQPSSGETLYPTLRDALCDADSQDDRTPWIITQDGDILNPREIRSLRGECRAGSSASLTQRLAGSR